MSLIMLVIMIFLHIFADFSMQGILASMKQKSWWEIQVPDLEKTIYKNDYKTALWIHSLEWAFVIMIPMLLVTFKSAFSTVPLITYLVSYLFLVPVHYFIDELKANKKVINLRQDQLVHLAQIVSIWVLWTGIVGW